MTAIFITLYITDKDFQYLLAKCQNRQKNSKKKSIIFQSILWHTCEVDTPSKRRRVISCCLSKSDCAWRSSDSA